MSLIKNESNPDVLFLKSKLSHWFKHDHLSREQGLALLVDLDPEPLTLNALSNWRADKQNNLDLLELGVFLLNGNQISCYPESDDEDCIELTTDEENDVIEQTIIRFDEFVSRFKKLIQYWNSGKHPELTPPSYFIEWALSKNVHPAWLDSAIEFGLYIPKQLLGQSKQIEVKQPVNANTQLPKWRKAFEYESEGLNALYDLIERHYFDANGNPVYDPTQWTLKKNIKSNWLTGRTLDEADTIITSGNRKGKAEK